MKKFILALHLACSLVPLFSQTIIRNPVFEKTTHETLKISSITLSEKETVIDMNITGDDGWFCADTSYYIKNCSNGKKYKLIKAINAPVCPKSFKFHHDSLLFQLIFPPIDKNTDYIDIIEGCDNACVKIEKVLINSTLSEIKKGYEEAKEAFSDKDYVLSLLKATNVLSAIKDTTCLDYGLTLLMIADNHLRLKHYDEAEKWYSKILSSNLSDSLETGDFVDPFANFRYKAYRGIAYTYEFREDWQKSMHYVMLAKNFNFNTYSPTHRLEEAVDILEWIVFLDEKMKDYDKAIYDNLSFIIDNFGSGIRERLYIRANQRLVQLVDKHYERYGFKAKLDSSVKNIVITKQDNSIIASFVFLNHEYRIIVGENEKDIKTDENYRLVLGFENRTKDAAYFKNRIVNQLYYERIQLMSGYALTKKDDLVYYLDKPYTGMFFEFWTSGNNRTKGELKNGVFDGEFIFYHENGNVKESGKMVNGKRTGPWKTFYDNETVESEGEYADNGYTGKWTYWYESGKQNVPVEISGYTINATMDEDRPKQKKAEYNYKNGLEEGPATVWYENGKVFRQGQCKEGKREGTWKQWDENGKLVKEGKYKNGQLQKGDRFDDE
jgi:antitoxin component YwqK of YwqJK toxin-antitoxin module